MERPGPAPRRELSEGKSAATDAGFLDNQERSGDFLVWHQHKHSIQPIFDFPVAVIPTPKKDEPGGFGMRGCEKTGIVQVSRQDDPSFLAGTIKHLHIRGPQSSDGGCMHGVVPLRRQPHHQVRRQRHVDEKPHRASSTVSSSERKAAYCKASPISPASRYG